MIAVTAWMRLNLMDDTVQKGPSWQPKLAMQPPPTALYGRCTARASVTDGGSLGSDGVCHSERESPTGTRGVAQTSQQLARSLSFEGK